MSKKPKPHRRPGRKKAAVPQWVSSYEKLGEILGRHRASFSRWCSSYADAPKPRSDGHHSVKAWFEFFARHPEIREGGDTSVAMQQLKLREQEEIVRKLNHLNDVREGKFTANEVFAGLITKAVGEAKSLLRQKFEFELPAYTAKQESAQIRILNKRAIDEVCARLGELSKEWAA